MVGEDFVGGGRVPRLDHAVVPGDHDERNPGGMESVECFEHGGISPGLGLDDIEEVACVDEDVGFLLDDHIYR